MGVKRDNMIYAKKEAEDILAKNTLKIIGLAYNNDCIYHLEYLE